MERGEGIVVRAVGVVVVDGRVLLHRGPDEQVWSLPGGRCEPREPAPAAVARELREELGVEVTVGTLRFVVDNLLVLRGQLRHELGLYFAVTPPPAWPALQADGPFPGVERDKGLVFQWFHRSSLATLPLVPSALSTYLAGDGDRIHYLFSDDRAM